jgi:hypothetical protein
VLATGVLLKFHVQVSVMNCLKGWRQPCPGTVRVNEPLMVALVASPSTPWLQNVASWSEPENGIGG